jgi:glycosyltransferase involved in cell wall biosynthesis
MPIERVDSSIEQPRILFVSANKGGGGSEELWLQSAIHLKKAGLNVSAVTAWTQDAAKRMAQLIAAKIPHISLAEDRHLLKRIITRILPSQFSAQGRLCRQLSIRKPDFVFFSSGTSLDGLELLECIAASGLPYGVVTHLVSTDHWPDDLIAEKMIRLFSGARRFWAVSRHNLDLLQTQLAFQLPSVRIARNPFLASGPLLPMPCEAGDSAIIRFAVPARLHPRTKGHDILFRVLAQKKWRDRAWAVSIYGTGSHTNRLQALAAMLGLEKKISFCGQTTDIEALWNNHHALLVPSRHEGLPLTVVEAMWLGRVVIAQPAGGIAEVIEDNQSGFLADGIGEPFFDKVLERAWSQRARWADIGKAASVHIRSIIPEHPEKDFAAEIAELARSGLSSDTNSIGGH